MTLTMLDYVLESVCILHSTGQLEQYEVLAILAYVYRGLHQFTKAVQCLTDAIKSASEVLIPFPIISAIPCAALLLADLEEVEYAVEYYALASRYPRVANSRWFEDIAGRYIANISITLPKEDIAAAKTSRSRTGSDGCGKRITGEI